MMPSKELLELLSLAALEAKRMNRLSLQPEDLLIASAGVRTGEASSFFAQAGLLVDDLRRALLVEPVGKQLLSPNFKQTFLRLYYRVIPVPLFNTDLMPIYAKALGRASSMGRSQLCADDVTFGILSVPHCHPLVEKLDAAGVDVRLLLDRLELPDR